MLKTYDLDNVRVVDSSFVRRGYECTVQCVRSASTWSTGLKYDEHSIENAYIEMIRNAEHYIYIEVVPLLCVLRFIFVH